MFKKIVVPLDGSKLAEEALATAYEMAVKFGSELTLLRVVPSPLIPGNPINIGYADLIVTLKKQNREIAAAYLKNVKRSFKEEGCTIRTMLIEDEQPANTILSVINEKDIDLVVMSTHGRGGLARWVYGSVAEKLLRYGQVPILLIRSFENEVTLKTPAIESEEDLHAHERVGA